MLLKTGGLLGRSGCQRFCRVRRSLHLHLEWFGKGDQAKVRWLRLLRRVRKGGYEYQTSTHTDEEEGELETKRESEHDLVNPINLQRSSNPLECLPPEHL